MRLSQKITIYFLILFLLSGCSSILTGMMGVKSPKKVSDKQIIKYSKKYNIPLADSYKMDSAYYEYLFSLDTLKFNTEIHDHYQPLQALYYDNHEFVSYYVNCYAGGFPNLEWNKDNDFDNFPPKTQAPLDSIFTLNQHLKYLQPLNANPLNLSSFKNVIIVHWNRMMHRQSKRFVQYVQGNAELSVNQSIKVLYVNTDSFFYEKLK